jgi:hypothetical protein
MTNYYHSLARIYRIPNAHIIAITWICAAWTMLEMESKDGMTCATELGKPNCQIKCWHLDNILYDKDDYAFLDEEQDSTTLIR